ncbi:MAG: tripartite tricarboxylate transporter permease [Alphaproteobacteria bacterium]|nr:tripartite tricarboxylate transporter permease [Alphaproteobacteria bacterium]MCW5742515.1 tripartite tricarboxylate transporter permease [Alphaproteobacteria bacterium]
MEILNHVILGFGVALTFENLLYCLIGCMVGTLIGVLPGIGPVATIAMLLPLTFKLPPTSALIMLAGIYYGAQYGGSTTAILVNLPGEASSVVTALDGYKMAQKGRAGAALSISAVGSFFAGTVGTILIVMFAPALTEMAQKFGPAEYCSLMALGLVAAVVLASGSVVKAIAMVFLGLLFGLVGTDVNTGAQRYTFNVPELSDGIDFAPIAMGLFGIAEIIANLEKRMSGRDLVAAKISSLWPTREEVRQAIPAVVRGTALGSLLGVLPGGGPTLGAFSSYTLEKRLSKTPQEFGKGAVAGVAAPESANNAAAQTSFIPMLTLGIPSNAVMALMVGAMIIQGIQPGPEVMTKKPDLFWGMIASMWIGNTMLVIINLPMIGMWVRLLTVPYRFLYPAILLFCCIGAYSLANSTFHVFMVAAFGVVGYLFLKLGCEGAPFLLGLVLGPQMEEYFRRAMLLSRGDPSVFVTRPISAGLLTVTAILLLLMVLPNFRKKRQEAFQEEGD